MNWNFDTSAAPLDRRLWLATKCGKVSATNWDAKRESWSGLKTGEQPIAWQPYVVPKHPGAVSDGGLNIVTKHSEINLPIIDDVGAGP